MTEKLQQIDQGCKLPPMTRSASPGAIRSVLLPDLYDHLQGIF